MYLDKAQLLLRLKIAESTLKKMEKTGCIKSVNGYYNWIEIEGILCSTIM
jgi:hypothetical protein